MHTNALGRAVCGVMALSSSIAGVWTLRSTVMNRAADIRRQFRLASASPPWCKKSTLPFVRGAASPTARKHVRNDEEEDPRLTPLSSSPSFIFNGSVTILDRGDHHVVVAKPPGVVCHHSDWSGSRSTTTARGRGAGCTEVPMLQRTRQAVGRRVNLVHRLDRGASGCLLFTFARSDEDGHDATATLQECMMNASTATTSTLKAGEKSDSPFLGGKTYIALVRGEGILRGRDLKKEGWFEVNRPIRDVSGNLNNATTYFSFLAGQDNGNGTLDRPRASLVLAKIKTGRWHQIRRHLNGLSHPIIGDSSHGNSKTNREWREKWGLPPERTLLHLLKLELPPTPVTPSGISVVDTLAPDMMQILADHLPELLVDAEKALKLEGLSLLSAKESIKVPIRITIT
jgi:tRNA pseudouridine65 synthase